MGRYKFDDIAVNCTERRAPELCDENTYISIGNMEAENLNIDTYGTETNLTGDKLVIHPGDVLFMRRDPWQRKVAISPIEGTFSPFGMVFRAKEDVMSQEFLPYLVSSDCFIDEVSRLSVGTLYKAINWKDLKNIEFEIPDLEMQDKLLPLLQELTNLKSKYNSLAAELGKLTAVKYAEMKDGADIKELGSLMTLVEGARSYSNVPAEQYMRMTDLTGRSWGKSDKTQPDSFYGYPVATGQLAISRLYFKADAIAMVPDKYDGAITANTTALFNIKEQVILPEYLFYTLTHQNVLEKANIDRLSDKNWYNYLSNYKIAVPPMETQREFVDILQNNDKSIVQAKKCAEQTMLTVKSLVKEYIQL